MALRKASSYSKKRVRPYTRRSRTKQKAYIKTVPQSKIVKFYMGDIKKNKEGRHPYVVKLITKEKVQIRDNALEACRMLINKIMDRDAPGQYYFVVNVYPHHILRENKGGGGGVAGADRISSGMSHSFGTNVGRAAIVNTGMDIFYISCENEKAARTARAALTHVKAKIPCRSRILFEKLKEMPQQIA